MTYTYQCVLHTLLHTIEQRLLYPFCMHITWTGGTAKHKCAHLCIHYWTQTIQTDLLPYFERTCPYKCRLEVLAEINNNNARSCIICDSEGIDNGRNDEVNKFCEAHRTFGTTGMCHWKDREKRKVLAFSMHGVNTSSTQRRRIGCLAPGAELSKNHIQWITFLYRI
jgi:hypothetical protein